MKNLKKIGHKVLLGSTLLLMPLLAVGVLMLVFSCKANAKGKTKHPIYSQIITNSPSINKKYAMKLSNIIYRKARKYDIRADLLTAILAQESMYRMVQGSCSTGYVEIDMGYLKATIPETMRASIKAYTNEEITVCADFGIGQINYRNIAKLGFDKERLLTDLDYSVDIAALMLKKKYKYYGKTGPDWWTRYNAYDPDKRKIYKKMVERFL